MPTKKNTIVCPCCKNFITYTEEDKQTSEHRFPDHLYYYTYIKCPSCGCGIGV